MKHRVLEFISLGVFFHIFLSNSQTEESIAVKKRLDFQVDIERYLKLVHFLHYQLLVLLSRGCRRRRVESQGSWIKQGTVVVS